MRLSILFLGILLLSGCDSISQSLNAEERAFLDSLRQDSILQASKPKRPDPLAIRFQSEKGDSFDVQIINSTYLHTEARNYYGDEAPDRLRIIWQTPLGSGNTSVGAQVRHWSGAGWTGQPLIVRENNKLYLIQGCFDHHLKKIDAQTGKILWKTKFVDVLKGTGTLWINHQADSLKDRVVVLQGSRAGAPLSAAVVPSFKAVSYFTGEELWSLNSPRTLCYSRDVDGSPLVINDTAYLPLETSIFCVFNPDRRKGSLRQGLFQPQIYKDTDTLYLPSDNNLHRGNLVTEASPVRLRNHIYIASGSGHVWGYNLETQKMDWEFFIGSDIDGTPVVTADSCLLIAVEKQYINGPGGILKLDPRKQGEEAIVWYFPTGNRNFASWQGGVIGSATVNDAYRESEDDPYLASFVAIDGNLYVIDYMNIDSSKKATLYDNKTQVPMPKLLSKHQVGGSISTPIFVKDKIVAMTYDGTYLFRYDKTGKLQLLDRNDKRGEATPIVHNRRIYVASRDGNLYCYGD